MHIRKYVPLALLPLVALLTGCSEKPSSASLTSGPIISSEQIREIGRQLRTEGKVRQADILEQGSVSFPQYEGAFRNLRDCVEEKGYSLSEPQTNPLNGVTYSFVLKLNSRNPEKAAADYSSCKEQHWSMVAAVFENTSRKVMDSALWAATRDCLAAAGFEAPSKPGLLVDMVGEKPVGGDGVLSPRAKAATSCVEENAMRLYPKLATVDVSF